MNQTKSPPIAFICCFSLYFLSSAFPFISYAMLACLWPFFFFLLFIITIFSFASSSSHPLPPTWYAFPFTRKVHCPRSRTHNFLCDVIRSIHKKRRKVFVCVFFTIQEWAKTGRYTFSLQEGKETLPTKNTKNTNIKRKLFHFVAIIIVIVKEYL